MIKCPESTLPPSNFFMGAAGGAKGRARRAAAFFSPSSGAAHVVQPPQVGKPKTRKIDKIT